MRPLALLLALALTAGCLGSTDSDAGGEASPSPATPTPSPEPPSPVSLAVSTSGAYPVNPGFSPSTLTAPAGAEVTVTLTNAESAPLVPHDWVLEGVDGAGTGNVAPGDSASVTFVAPAPGDYVFFCSLGDHRERGMVGTFTVTAA